MADISKIKLPNDNTTYNVKDSSAVTTIKINGAAQTKTNGVVNLPAYPTTLPASDTTSTYSSSGTAPVNGKAVASAIGGLDVASKGGAGKYIQAISETDGKISATEQTMDTTPTESSTKAVTSGGVYTALASKANASAVVTSVAAGVGLTTASGSAVTSTGTIKAKLKSETAATNDSATPTNTGSRQYAVTPDKSGYLSVNVPWSDYVPSAYCGTAAGTAAKTASCTSYVLASNSYVHVTIATANTSQTALTLNINSKGAKPIYINGTASSTSNYTLPAGTYIVYYNGTNYYFRTDGKITGAGMVDIGGNTGKFLRGDGTWQSVTTGTVTSVAAGTGLTTASGSAITGSGTVKAKLKSETAATNDSATPTNTGSRQYAVTPDKSGYLSVNVPWTNTYTSAYCTTAADTAAKAASCSSYSLLTNSYIHVVIATANSSKTALTFNINSKGAKPIYINGAASSTSNYTLPAGSYLVFYDGTNYYFRTDGKITTKGVVSTGNDDLPSVFYGTCATAAGTATKEVTVSNTNFRQVAGTVVGVKFTNTNTYSATAANPVKLKVGSNTAVTILGGNGSVPTGTNTTFFGVANRTHWYMWNGSNWVFMSHSTDNNTTYANRTPAAGGTQTSLCTDGDKYKWNLFSGMVAEDGMKNLLNFPEAKFIASSIKDKVVYFGWYSQITSLLPYVSDVDGYMDATDRLVPDLLESQADLYLGLFVYGIPPGTYIFSAKIFTTSSETVSSGKTCSIKFEDVQGNNCGSATIACDTGKVESVSITITATQPPATNGLATTLYVTRLNGQTAGYLSMESVMLCKPEVYNVSPEYEPFVLSRKRLNNLMLLHAMFSYQS